MANKEAIKRVMDLLIVFSTAPVTLPLVALWSLAVVLESEGGPIFAQKRIGKDGRPFTVYKIRTMIKDAHKIGAGLYYEPDDKRFTRLGKIARKYSIDELPQFLNVLKSEMSIVGPRPQL